MTKAPFQAHFLTKLGPKKPGQVSCADFISDEVHDQLEHQGIAFSPRSDFSEHNTLNRAQQGVA